MGHSPDPMTAGTWAIEARQSGLAARLVELWEYRRLWWYFAAAEFRQLYRKSTLGWLWMLLRVTGPIGVSALFFGGILGVRSEGLPYFLFLLCGMAAWIPFERSLLIITRSLERNRKLVTKVYFPRLVLPLAALAPSLLYLLVVIVALVAAIVVYRQRDGVWYVTLTPQIAASVAAVVGSFLFAVAIGLWTSVLQAQYRDVRYGLRYFMPFWMYLTPVIYPITHIPEKWRWLVAFNPMAPLVEAFRWGTIGGPPLSVAGLVTSMVLIFLTLTGGLWFFTRAEAASVDKL